MKWLFGQYEEEAKAAAEDGGDIKVPDYYVGWEAIEPLMNCCRLAGEIINGMDPFMTLRSVNLITSLCDDSAGALSMLRDSRMMAILSIGNLWGRKN